MKFPHELSKGAVHRGCYWPRELHVAGEEVPDTFFTDLEADDGRFAGVPVQGSAVRELATASRKERRLCQQYPPRAYVEDTRLQLQHVWMLVVEGP